MQKICCQSTIRNLVMQQLQHDLRLSAAKVLHAAAAARNIDAFIPPRSEDTRLQSTIELRATAAQIAAPKPGSRRQVEKRRFWSNFLHGNLPKRYSQPSCSHLNTNLRLSATITHAAAAARSLYAATPPRYADTELQVASLRSKDNTNCATVSKQNDAQRQHKLRLQNPKRNRITTP